MKIAWHEVPGMHASMIPSGRARYDKGGAEFLCYRGEKPWDLNHAVPYGTDLGIARIQALRARLPSLGPSGTKIIFRTLTPMRAQFGLGAVIQHSRTPLLRSPEFDDSLSDEAQALCCRPA